MRQTELSTLIIGDTYIFSIFIIYIFRYLCSYLATIPVIPTPRIFLRNVTQETCIKEQTTHIDIGLRCNTKKNITERYTWNNEPLRITWSAAYS